jgi:hypothetical protein
MLRRTMPRTGLLPRIALWMALSSASVPVLSSPDAHASTSLAVTWEGLLRESTAAVVVTPLDSRAAWEDGRIYTYTRARVDRSVSGQLAALAEVSVRTLGGVIGKIGQSVEGEAVLVPQQPSLLFLHAGPAGAYDVTARGQGQFPVVMDDPKLPPRVVRSHAVGALLIPRVAPPLAAPQLAADFLHGRFVDDVARDIAAAWDRTHAR